MQEEKDLMRMLILPLYINAINLSYIADREVQNKRMVAKCHKAEPKDAELSNSFNFILRGLGWAVQCNYLARQSRRPLYCIQYVCVRKL